MRSYIWLLGQIGLNEEIYGTSDMVGSLALFSFWNQTGRGWGAAVKDSLKTYHNLRKNAKKKTFVSKCLNSIQSQILEFVQTH